MKGLGLKEVALGIALSLTPAACGSSRDEAGIRKACEEERENTTNAVQNTLEGTGSSWATPKAIEEGEKAERECLKVNGMK
jgi:hypothetical protein